MSEIQKTVIGIETSCDETAVAIVRSTDSHNEILAEAVLSQIDQHSHYGGVIPEIAARSHVDVLDILIKQTLLRANMQISDMDSIAVTAGPGLMGGLIVGLMTAKAISYASHKPFYAINHLEGHILTSRLTDGVAFPYLVLLVSGGHTQILLVRNIACYDRLGTTIDDAIGECFDKIAKSLGLSYPGGVEIEKEALMGDGQRFNFPCPSVEGTLCDFSFSGLKTSVQRTIRSFEVLKKQDVSDICASFQVTIVRILQERLKQGFNLFSEAFPHKKAVLVVSGGVASNSFIRSSLVDFCALHGFRFIAPPARLCTDNAVMIAWAALERMVAGFPSDDISVLPRPRWPLDEKSPAKIGSGKRGVKA
ncbi:tRNA (adenosine(37)-N6)-threonylcarbamoyltransferase complex transferase subunit TsaD [Candidatus Liberibacter africanus]|uniref:tRNA N6-adenosine threonylcarbamoyltransferase n=1 Tax=Candidatus Liberibacter africanus PTSAPSY TaxID=1277257 RepID=A0A0G3I9T2_LIBAF|nr:tRNA (adenosine(37)-N6)-threonylcarbamoyltransferase complex transferase subunit TsaD [Candidatus Liberibacter africanus]AKK20557.1 putative DNA-binding/iron metalloprotein/AP endonuclease [Candidatus Liberibacter africanus PTSAPSY]QTP64257.1 tRNA (adenosine(37)-N6)-threonylcarbamoyltransferase complex transferase subunit TsaD [Candidatus Liberibacter africanus]